ncbi:MAG TPA: VapC toxin family PIN domain ribonuclease [Chloroflexi bacterium]|nr:VapC toxin family PIN domain ribonuclease [Chloroflexota bacterium]HHW85527.1 type II toxin-antitoxin system VapC family toxin [Chloroflexota bacterium]
MTLQFLLDTNILSEPLRPHPNPQVMVQLRHWRHAIAIPTIVWHELWFGCYRLQPSTRRTAIERYLTNVVAVSLPVLPYDARAAHWHANERARLSALGKTPPFADGMIAAIARTNDLTLVTFNLDDYRAFDGLRITDWQT